MLDRTDDVVSDPATMARSELDTALRRASSGVS